MLTTFSTRAELTSIRVAAYGAWKMRRQLGQRMGQENEGLPTFSIWTNAVRRGYSVHLRLSLRVTSRSMIEFSPCLEWDTVQSFARYAGLLALTLSDASTSASAAPRGSQLNGRSSSECDPALSSGDVLLAVSLSRQGKDQNPWYDQVETLSLCSYRSTTLSSVR